jgi:hypothetical protein
VRTRATDDDVLDIPERSAPHGRGHGQPSRGNALPPPPHMSVRLEQLLAMQNELMTLPSRAPFEALYGTLLGILLFLMSLLQSLHWISGCRIVKCSLI